MSPTAEPAQPAGDPVANQEPSTPATTPLPNQDALVKVLQPLVEAAVTKSVQSMKDTRIGRLEHQVTGFAEQLQRLKELQAAGMSEPAALRQMALEDTVLALQQAQQPVANSGTPAAGGTASAVLANVDPKALLEAMGFQATDAEAASLAAKNDLAGLVGLVQKRKQPQPNPAGIQPAGGGQPAGQDLMAEYKKRASALRPGSEAMLALRNEYRKKGLAL